MLLRPLALLARLVIGMIAVPAQVPSAVPPPVPQRTVECAAPVYATDALVCGDEDLRRLDRALADLYAIARRSGLEDESAGIETGEAWFRRRSLCAFAAVHRDCAIAAYRERTAVMQALLSSRGLAFPLRVTCGPTTWRGRWTMTAAGLRALVLADEGTRLSAVALEGADGPSWRAFLSARLDAGRLTLTGRATDAVTCTQATDLHDVSDDGLRQRVEVIDAVLAHARGAYRNGEIDRAAYTALLGWLRDEELTVHAEAGLRSFADLTTDNYWHRSRLKFPTALEQELEHLDRPVPR